MGAITGKRILVLANDIKTIRWFRMELLRALLGLGAEVHLVMPDTGDERDLLDMGCLIHHVKLSRHGCNPLVELGLLGQYRAIFQRLRPDLVLSFTIKPNIYGTLTAYRAGCPIVCNITGTGAAFLKNNGLSAVIRHLYRYALPHAHRVFFQNREDMHYFQTHRLLGGNGELLPWGSGVNLTLHTPSPMPPDGITHFVFVGRVVAIKGVDTLFACAERMAREKLPCRFHIAGLVEASRYQKRVKALREAGVLIDHGLCSPIDPVLRACHCVVLPSQGGEGVPNSLMEGSACGRACIASRVNGSRDVVIDGKTGFLFPAGDEEALYDCLVRFMRLPYAEKVAMGQAGRRHVEAYYDRQNVVDRYCREAIELLGGEPT